MVKATSKVMTEPSRRSESSPWVQSSYDISCIHKHPAPSTQACICTFSEQKTPEKSAEPQPRSHRGCVYYEPGQPEGLCLVVGESNRLSGSFLIGSFSLMVTGAFIRVSVKRTIYWRLQRWFSSKKLLSRGPGFNS